MRPSEVLDAQIDLRERLRYSPPFRTLMDSWANAEVGLGGSTATAFRFADTLAQHLDLAHTYRVTHDMAQMVEWMSGQLDGTDQFQPDLAPTPAGFVCFDKPLTLVDARGRTMLIHWLVWGPGQIKGPYGVEPRKALAMTAFNDTWRQPDQVQMWNEDNMRAKHGEARMQEFLTACGRFMPVNFGMGFEEERLGPPGLIPSEKHAAEILASGDTPVPGTNPLRLVHALFLLLNQTIVSVSEEEPDRAGRRRAGKAGLPPKVTVIRLRREEQVGYDPDRGESMVEWQHRWIVRQHWRWQPYGPRKGAEHVHEYASRPVVEKGGLVRRCMVEGCENYVARIIIPMAVKGPADAPLKQSEKVYDLAR